MPGFLAYPGVTELVLTPLRRIGVQVSVTPVELTPESVFRLESALRLLDGDRSIKYVLLVGDDAIIRMMTAWLKDRMRQPSAFDEVEFIPVTATGFKGFALGIRQVLEERGLLHGELVLDVPMTSYVLERFRDELFSSFHFSGCQVRIQMRDLDPPPSAWRTWGAEYLLNRLFERGKRIMCKYFPGFVRQREIAEQESRKQLFAKKQS
jgi:hypothetical protein